MKKSFFGLLFMALATTGFAQPAKTTKPAAKPLPALKNQMDSVSYAVGMSVANYYKKEGIKTLNATIVAKGINDMLGGKTMLLSDQAANSVMNNYLTMVKGEKSKPNIEAGQKCIAENKSKPGIITTASGLQYQVMREGDGDKPTLQDSVTCHYRGYFLDGKDFDNSYSRGEPITFALNGVIPGWTEGLQLMKKGSKYKFWIPYNLAYGPSDYSSIPGGSLLIFEVELLEVRKKS